MAHPVFRWSRLLPITALLVVTTGVAAAPIRQAWLPIVARPLGFDIGTMPAAAPMHLASSATIRRDNAELQATMTGVPDRLQLLERPTSQTSGTVDRRDERPSGTPSWATSGGNRRGGNFSGGSSGNLNGSSGFTGAGSGGLLGSRATPSVGPPRSYSRTENASEGRNGGGSSGSGNVSGGGASGGGGAPGGGAPGTGSGSGNVADGIFTDHTSGLPELTGKGRKGHGGGGDGSKKHGGRRGGRGGPDIAASPEPSTILLFGTGLAAIAGAVRRRMRR